jgi:hypothetical protein
MRLLRPRLQRSTSRKQIKCCIIRLNIRDYICNSEYTIFRNTLFKIFDAIVVLFLHFRYKALHTGTQLFSPNIHTILLTEKLISLYLNYIERKIHVKVVHSDGKSKVVPVSSCAKRHEEVQGCKGTAPHILDLGTILR